MYQPRAGRAEFYVYTDRHYENTEIFQKCVAVTSGRSVRPQAVGWLAGCSSALARCSDIAGMSQSIMEEVLQDTNQQQLQGIQGYKE